MEREWKQEAAELVRKVLIIIALVTLAAAAWKLSSLLIIVFGGVLLAVVFRRLAGILADKTPLSRSWALRVVFVLFAVLIIGGIWLFGAQMADQMHQLQQKINEALQTVEGTLSQWGIDDIADGGQDREGTYSLAERFMSGVTNAATMLLTFLAGVLILLFVAIYTSVNPALYQRGVLLLVPKTRQHQVTKALDQAEASLWRWMLGQFISMVFVGALATAALYMLNVPMALSLGLIAGFLEFIPILGPWLAAVPAVLVGLTEDVTTALWVAAAYFVIQQIEGYIILPLAERWSVALPPALTVVATMAFTLLFGFIGLLFATPITVVAMVLVRQLYVRDTLGREPASDTKMPG